MGQQERPRRIDTLLKENNLISIALQVFNPHVFEATDSPAFR